jgi:hypothetical protein
VAVRTVTVVVPMAPPKELATNRRGSAHWRYRQAAAKLLRTTARAVTLEQHAKAGWEHYVWFTRPVDVHEHIVWPKGQRRFDPDGLATLCKPALDGIVDAGLIPNDSAVYIRKVIAEQSVGDDAQGKIIITLTEVN